MKTLDQLSANDAITLYYEKHDALRRGDMAKLMEIKNKCPDIFDKEKDEELRDMIEYIKAFQNSDRYKYLKKADLKEKLQVITNNDKN